MNVNLLKLELLSLLVILSIFGCNNSNQDIYSKEKPVDSLQNSKPTINQKAYDVENTKEINRQNEALTKSGDSSVEVLFQSLQNAILYGELSDVMQHFENKEINRSVLEQVMSNAEKRQSLADFFTNPTLLMDKGNFRVYENDSSMMPVPGKQEFSIEKLPTGKWIVVSW